MSRKTFAYLFLLVSLLGFLDASYLTIEHYRGVVPPCAIVDGCETVTTSAYSVLFGIPVALLGAVYYLLITVLSVLYIDTTKELALKTLSRLTILGLLASAYFIYIQGFVLHAWCIYCLGSATTSTLLFIIGRLFMRSNHNNVAM